MKGLFSAAIFYSELLHGVFLQSGNNPGYLRSFFTAFLKESVHRYSSVNIDLTPAFIAVLVFGVVWLLYRQRSVTLTEGKKLIGYELLIFLITYSMLLFAHLTMFYHETAYLESSKMIEQMTRYSSPANLGLLMLSVALLLRHGKEKGFPKKHLWQRFVF